MSFPDITGHQITIYVPASPSVCFRPTWIKQNKQNITFLFNAVSLINWNNTHLAHYVQISSTLADSIFNCPVVQLLTVNIWNISYLCKHWQGDVFSIRWQQCG